MTRLSNVAASLSTCLASTLFVAALVAATAPEASAQSKEQQSCVNGLNKSGAKVAATQGKDNSSCVKDAGSGNLDNPTVDACVIADNKGKVAKAEAKTTDAQAKCDPPLPTFGYTGAVVTNAAAVSEEVALLEDVFGSPVNTAIIIGGDGAKCQAGVSKAYEKVAATRMKEFNNCKKSGLKAGTITNPTQLQLCISADPKSKYSGAVTKLTDTITNSCDGVTLATAFPGCSAEAANAAALSGCIERNSECHMCLLVNAMDALSIGCDQFDDGLLNATCRQCGNSTTEAPEVCDTGGNSLTCDSDCTAVSCGDGLTNIPAGEACDASGETAGCDDDCTLPVCQDGNLNTLAGEVCDDGNNTNGDGCDNNCTVTACGNGITTGVEACDDGNAVNTDACLNSCAIATCGDGVTCSAGGCTSGPSGGVEACDDADVDDNDSCRNNCAVATCGDGVLCNQVGCTTGPSGGLEQCDNNGLNSNVTPNACRTNCRPAFCGDTVTDAGETCDGGGVNTLTCDSNCTAAACGDGFVNSAAGETCDTSGESISCDANCTARVCGDGTVNATAGETCDDGNIVSGDGCRNDCINGPGSGENDQQCPDVGELVLYSKLSNETCVNNGDCAAPRTCDPTLLLCTTIADLDSGWTGAGHDADINDSITAAARLLCEGPNAPGCGECTVLGLDPSPGNCRCANNILNKCDQPFATDNVNCTGGGSHVCDCYFGAPFPISSGGTPVCVSNRFAVDITGTANVDLGAGAITANLRTKVFSGLTLAMPCPVCGGKCSGDSTGCIVDADCNIPQTCVQDVPGDGVRNGKCVYDPDNHTDNGVACDADGTNSSFPAIVGDSSGGSGGGNYSIDCQPTVGANISGQGLKIGLNQTTGTTSLGFGVDCDGTDAGTDLCPCLTCSKDNSEPCSSDAQCASQGGFCSAYSAPTVFNCTTNTECASVSLGTCTALGNTRCSLATSKTCTSNADCLPQNIGPCSISTCSNKGGAPGVIPEPNDCTAGACTDQGGGEGECTTGPDQGYCDALVRSDGTGIAACSINADCTGGGYGNCTLIDRADCFLDPIEATGVADPNFPVAGAVFCIPPTSNGPINGVAGLPGPGRVTSQGAATTYCAGSPATPYNPGGIPACP